MSETATKAKFSIPGKHSEEKSKLFQSLANPPVKAPPPEQSLSPSPMDLTTLQNVKDFLGITGTDADDLIQGMITANGFFWLEFCSLGNQNQVNTQSPLNSVCTFTETYDGNGSFRFYLRNRPILTVTQLQINGVTFQQALQYGQAGFVIDGDAKSLSIQRGGGGNAATFSFAGWPLAFGSPYFQKGVQNISVAYTAGYSVTPFDVELAAKQTVALTYQQKDRLDQASRAMANGAGTISFRNFAIPPLALQTMYNYKRQSLY